MGLCSLTGSYGIFLHISLILSFPERYPHSEEDSQFSVQRISSGAGASAIFVGYPHRIQERLQKRGLKCYVEIPIVVYSDAYRKLIKSYYRNR